jgi:hypothetical protein
MYDENFGEILTLPGISIGPSPMKTLLPVNSQGAFLFLSRNRGMRRS